MQPASTSAQVSRRPLHHRCRGASTLIPVIILVLVAIIAASVTAWLMAKQKSGNAAESQVLPDLGAVPEWTLIDRNGDTFSSQDLAGQPYITSFYFLQCRGICPTMLAELKNLDQTIAQSPYKDKITLVGMSVDGERDTPQAITEYFNLTQLTDGVTELLTGEQQMVWDLSTNGFNVVAGLNADAQGNIKEGIEYLHTSKFTLVDGQGHIRGYYEHTDPQQMQQLLSDTENLLLNAVSK